MLIRMISIAIAVLGCAGQAQAQPTSTGPAQAQPTSALRATTIPVIDWTRRSSTTRLIPATAKHVQLVVTPGCVKDEQLGWVFAEGRTVLGVYRFAGNDASELIARISDLERTNHHFAFMVMFVGGPPPGAPPPPNPPPAGSTTPITCGGSPIVASPKTGGSPGEPPWVAERMEDTLQRYLKDYRAPVGAPAGQQTVGH